MAGNYIICNKLHNNGLMTDLGLHKKLQLISLSATHQQLPLVK